MMEKIGTHGLGGFIRKGAIKVVPSDCDRCDLAGGRSFAVVGIVLRHIVVIIVLRQEGGSGSGEEADEEGDGDGGEDLAEATAAEASDHLVHLFPAKNHHFRLYCTLHSTQSTVL